MIRKPAVLSAMGLAASVAVLLTWMVPWGVQPTVQAAMIMQKLNAQVEQSQLFEITFESLTLEEVSIDGKLQVSQTGIAGDLQVTVREGLPEEVVDVDLSLALSDDDGWILFRKLVVSDPEAQAIVTMFFPPGSETLLLLPDGADSFDVALELDQEFDELRSGLLVPAFKELIDAHEDYGATVQRQRDGSYLLTLPIKDAEALGALERLAAKVHPDTETKIVIGASGTAVEISGDVDAAAFEDPDVKAALEEADVTVEITESHIGHDEDELIGSTLTAVYDPETEVVRSFGIHDLGATGGSITVTIREGEIDPALLDPDRVKTSATRVLDLNTLMPLLGLSDHEEEEEY